MKIALILILFVLISSCFYTRNYPIRSEITNVSSAVCVYKGIKIKDTVGDRDFIDEIIDSIYLIDKYGNLKLFLTNHVTNIIVVYNNDNTLGWVEFNNGRCFTDTIYLNAYHYFNNKDENTCPIYEVLVHECWHVILNVKFKNLDNQEAREKVCDREAGKTSYYNLRN